jgi:hypothetical protein
MAGIDRIQGALTSSDYLTSMNSVEKQATPAPPAAPLAVPVETARAEVNAASLTNALMVPTHDAIYGIGGIGVKLARNIASVSSTWGF